MTGGVIYTLVNSIVRIYPLIAAQGKTLPLATYTVNREPINDMNGPATSAHDSVEITVHSKSYDECEALKNSIIQALDWQTGPIGDVNLINVRYTGDDDLYQDDPEVYGKRITFDFWVEL